MNFTESVDFQTVPRLWQRNAFVLVIALAGISAAIQSAPALASSVRLALQLQPLPVWRRREALFGPYYESVRTIRRQLPEETPIAIVLADESDLVNGIFASSYLYPRPSVIYSSFADWETHRFDGAVRIRPRPLTIVWLNDDVTPEARIMAPDAIRRELESP